MSLLLNEAEWHLSFIESLINLFQLSNIGQEKEL